MKSAGIKCETLSADKMINSSTQYNAAIQPCCFMLDVMGWRLILYKMYEKLNSEPMTTEQPEHLAMATEMANALMDRFEPQEQNEALKHFHMLIKERRQRMIDDADKKAAWLKETFQQL